jgi:hypothetical protein
MENAFYLLVVEEKNDGELKKCHDHDAVEF